MGLLTAPLNYPGWTIIRKIGSGSSGCVYEIERQLGKEKEHAALKCISIPPDESEIDWLSCNGYDEDGITAYFSNQLDSVIQEYSLMKELRDCPYVVNRYPTCDTAGYQTGTCSCGDSITQTLDPLGHSYVNDVCTRCGALSASHVHNYVWSTSEYPTCMATGYETGTCDCGNSITRTISALGHNYINGICTRCGAIDYSMHSHNYSWSTTVSPSCESNGSETGTCACGNSITQDIPALGHNYVDGICTRCGKNDSSATVYVYAMPAEGHSITPQMTVTEQNPEDIVYTISPAATIPPISSGRGVPIVDTGDGADGWR